MPLFRAFTRWALAGLAILACREQITAPAECPELCPGGYQIRDTVLVPVADQDSSYEGYVLPGQGSSLRVSRGLPASEDRAIIRFRARADSFLFDSLRPFTDVDSVTIGLHVLRRDTLVAGIKLFLYRLPITIDSTATFGSIDPLLTPANLIDSLILPDTTVNDTTDTLGLTTVLKGADLAKVAIPAADSGVLAVGVALAASGPTGVRLGSLTNGSFGPLVTYYVSNSTVTDTTKNHRKSTIGGAFNSFVSQSPPALDPNLLTVGGAPSARALLRFTLPPFLRDSAQLIRATLEVVPTGTVLGLPGDTSVVEARNILADFGAKSAISTTRLSQTVILDGQSDTLRLEVVNLMRAWQGTTPVPTAILLSMNPEASSFVRATFGSTRTPGHQPRLRLTYALPYHFTRP